MTLPINNFHLPGPRQRGYTPPVKKRRPRHSLAEYFLATVGALLLLLLGAMLAFPKGCTVAPSPEIGVRPSQPTPSP